MGSFFCSGLLGAFGLMLSTPTLAQGPDGGPPPVGPIPDLGKPLGPPGMAHFETGWVTWRAGAHTRGENKSGGVRLTVNDPRGEWTMCTFRVDEVSRIGDPNKWTVKKFGNQLDVNWEIETHCTALGAYCPKSSIYVNVTAYLVIPAPGTTFAQAFDAINNRPAYKPNPRGRGGRGIPWPDDVKCDGKTFEASKEREMATTTDLFNGRPRPVDLDDSYATMDVECVDGSGSRIGNAIVTRRSPFGCTSARGMVLTALDGPDVCRYQENRTNMYAQMGSKHEWVQTQTCR